MDKVKVPPLYQKLYRQGSEIDDECTMRSLGIVHGDELEIEVFDQDHSVGISECYIIL